MSLIDEIELRGRVIAEITGFLVDVLEAAGEGCDMVDTYFDLKSAGKVEMGFDSFRRVIGVLEGWGFLHTGSFGSANVHSTLTARGRALVDECIARGM